MNLREVSINGIPYIMPGIRLGSIYQVTVNCLTIRWNTSWLYAGWFLLYFRKLSGMFIYYCLSCGRFTYKSSYWNLFVK